MRRRYRHRNKARASFARGGGATLGRVLIAAALAGCTASRDPGPTMVTTTSVTAAGAGSVGAVSREALVGSWGVASYHVETDRARTEAQARAQCSQPYVIQRGPTDGVLMHAADDPKIYELRLKPGPDGRVYLGFEAPPGHRQDRDVLSATGTMVVMRFVDPAVDRRYGTFVYVRCT